MKIKTNYRCHSTRKGIFQYERMLFALTNALATFHRLMDNIIKPDLMPKDFTSLDNIIIVSRGLNEYLYYLNLVIDKLIEANLTIRPKKC